MRLAILDIGATAVGLLDACVEHGALRCWGDARLFVRFGDNTLTSGFIAEEAWHSTLQAVDELMIRALSRSPDRLLALGTSVMREASNAHAFRKAVRHRHGLDLRTLSSVEESILTYQGALSSLDGEARPTTVIDVGGGCVNFAVGHAEICHLASSLPLGVIRLLPAFAPNGSLSARDAAALASLVRRSLGPIASAVDSYGSTRVVLSSTVARIVRDYVCPQGASAPAVLTRDGIVKAQAGSLGVRMAELVMRGVRAEVADVLPIALTVVLGILAALDCDEVTVVERGLREGAALELGRAAVAGAQTLPRLPHRSEPRV